MSTPRPTPRAATAPTKHATSPDTPAATRGAALLDEARAFLSAFVVWPSQAYLNMVTLWVGFTHMRDANGDLCGQTNPHLFVTSDDYGGGKSTALMTLSLLAYKMSIDVCPTGPGAVRAISEQSCSYGVDEWDVMMGRGSGAPLFRSMLTGNFTRRTAWNRSAATRRFIFTPIALCGRGNLIMVNDLLRAVVQRSHVVPMREKLDHEHVRDFDEDIDPGRGELISSALAEWGARVGVDAARLRPAMPDGVSNRRVDLWRPLLRVARAAGGHWVKTAEDACRTICLSETADDAAVTQLSAAERTLVDVSYVFGLSGADKLTTRTLLDLLAERPGGGHWGDYPTDKAASMALAADLATFGVPRGSGKVTVDGRQLQGYAWASIAPHIPDGLPVFVPAASSGADDDTLDLPFE